MKNQGAPPSLGAKITGDAHSVVSSSITSAFTISAIKLRSVSCFTVTVRYGI